jgi:hypothetical protein
MVQFVCISRVLLSIFIMKVIVGGNYSLLFVFSFTDLAEVVAERAKTHKADSKEAFEYYVHYVDCKLCIRE